MKTRLLIIVGIVIASTISLSYYAIYDSSTTVFISCTPQYEQVDGKCVLLKPEQYCTDWCNIQELSDLGCGKPVLDYIFRATNLFDEEFGDVYYRNAIGLPDGVSEKQFEECADIIREKRISSDSEKLEPQNDVTPHYVYDNKTSKLQDKHLLNPASFVNMQSDMIAQKLVSVTDDNDLEKTRDDKRMSTYTTQKGDMRIGKTGTYDYSRFVDYGLYGKENVIPKNQAEEFVDYVFETIGYQRDGTEWIDSTDFGSRKEIVIQQRKDGWIIQNEINRFNFRDDNTSIQLGRWYNDLDSFEIKYSQDDAKNIAYDYIQSTIRSDPRLKEMNLEVSDPSYAQMKIVKNHLVYGISGIYPHTEVQIDAYSGSIVNAEQITITGKEILGCASIGVTRLIEQDVEKIEKRTGTLLYFKLTDNDLESLPVLKEMIDATDRTEYNDRVLLPISSDKWDEYKMFFKEKFDEQYAVYYEADLRSNHILHDGKRYHVHYNENYAETPLWVEQLSDGYAYDEKAIAISDEELFDKTPLVKKAIDLIGTWEVSTRNSTGILESEQQRYQNYLLQKSIEKYGDDSEKHAYIFYYDENYYEPRFVIC